MIGEICAHLHNYFTARDDMHSGTFTVSGGRLTLPFLREGQYYRIIGSVFNDGIHVYGEMTERLLDECFSGAVWAMKIPADFLALVNEIEEWQEKNGAVASSPYTFESFGGYMYSKAGGKGGNREGSGSGGYDTSWKTAFRGRLNTWRKL